MKRVLSAVRRAGRALANRLGARVSAGWAPYSRLLVVGDQGGWVLDEERRELEEIARRIGIRVASPYWAPWVRNQAAFYCSQFILETEAWVRATHRVGTSYFHGLPGTGVPEFDRTFAGLRRHHERLTRVRVSHAEMRDLVLGSGIAPDKVRVIPIGINLRHFRVSTPAMRQRARKSLGIPEAAVVLGSFQKDGVGWGEGLEPKLIKGPDVFLRTIELLRPKVPELFVLLSGPARGYVKTGLEKLGVPYRHCYVRRYRRMGRLFHALDVCLITSRQEGGPKAVLESMASGVPLVTTRVGQAMDLVRHGENGWMVAIGDVEGLAHWTEHALGHPSDIGEILRAGRTTAEANSSEAQTPLWKDLLRGLVEW